MSTMILWMMQQKHVAAQIHAKIADHLSKAQRFELFLLVFFAVLREGVETVIYLDAARYVSEGTQLYGAILGIVAAVILGYLLFVASVKISLKKYFTVTSVLLLLFAAGLVSHGVHELQEVWGNLEAGEVEENSLGEGETEEVLWDMNPPINSDGSYPLLHEEGLIGALLKELFGYNPRPTFAEFVSYFGYLFVLGFLWRRIENKSALVAVKQ